jgi:Na+/proline symporter
VIRRDAGEKHYLIVSRWSIFGFGLLLGLIAFACNPIENILWFAFQIFSITGGATLGVFLLGLLTNVKVNRGNIPAMILSSLAMTALLLLKHDEVIGLAWSWLIVIGTFITMGLSILFSRFSSDT